jgi:hypothetical protein
MANVDPLDVKRLFKERTISRTVASWGGIVVLWILEAVAALMLVLYFHITGGAYWLSALIILLMAISALFLVTHFADKLLPPRLFCKHCGKYVPSGMVWCCD